MTFNIQWGSDPDFEWLKRDWFANGPDFKRDLISSQKPAQDTYCLLADFQFALRFVELLKDVALESLLVKAIRVDVGSQSWFGTSKESIKKFYKMN